MIDLEKYMSFSAINNISEMELKENSESFMGLKNIDKSPSLSKGRKKSNDELFEILRSMNVDLSVESLKELCRKFLSAEDMSFWLVKEKKINIKHRDDTWWLWISLTVLWERLFPEISHFELIDTIIQQGYEIFQDNKEVECCDLWTAAWEHIMTIAIKEKLDTIELFDSKFRGTQSFYNWFQDYETALHNAGIKNKKYFHKRISVLETFLEFFHDIEDNLYENSCSALAESYFKIGKRKKTDALFEEWLKKDPAWGWGWIHWADNYFLFTKKKDYIKAEEILLRGLKVNEVRDIEFILDRLFTIYEDTGNVKKMEEIEKKIAELPEETHQDLIIHDGDYTLEHDNFEENEIYYFGGSQPDIKKESNRKIGRNDPCPCGSGKKYKKCCLK